MKYMVIETFKTGMVDKVYERFNQKGRMLPDGVYYLDSWLSNDRTKCFQLMEADQFELGSKKISSPIFHNRNANW